MRKISRSIKRWLVVVISLGVLASILGYFFAIYLEKKIEEKISSQNGHVSTVHVNLFARSIHLHNVRWSSAADSSQRYPDYVTLKNVKIQGIALVPLLINQHLVIRHLVLDSGHVSLNTRNRQTSGTSEPALRFLRVNNVSVRSVQIRVQDDSLTTFSGHLHGDVSRLILEKDSIHAPRYSVKAAAIVVDTFQYTPTGGEYTTSIQHISINTKNRQIIVDSLLLIPLFGKYEFAKRLGEQRARLNVSVPKVVVNGWEWEKLVEKSVMATSLHIDRFDLYSFKDKRLPFLRTSVVPLPMESFVKLGWPIKIDSVVINNSTVTIETFPETGKASGILSLNQLNAIFTGLNNRWKTGDASNAVLQASALLMNTGTIKAQFHFPQDGSSVYTAKGSISSIELTKLNDVLGNMANLRITSGYLQDLSFNFRYTDFESKGSLDMAYKDLHILGLDKNKATTNELKTLLIRVFTPRDKSKSVPLSKAVGSIDIQRNRQKYVFNIWWKSILDGIQSSIMGNRTMPTRKNQR